MFTRRLPWMLVAGGLAACGDDIAATTASTGTSTTSGPEPDPATTDTPTSTSTGTTLVPDPTTTTDGLSASTTGTTTLDTSTGDTTTGSTSTGDTTTGDTTTGTSTGDTTTGTTTSDTTGDGTTGEPFVCIEPTDSDTAADPAGWSRSHGEPNKYLSTRHLAIAPNGDIVIATQFNGIIDLGDGPIDSGGSYQIALARYGVGGEFQWSTHIGGENAYLDPLAIAIDCGGNLVIGGAFDGDIKTQGKTLKVVPGFEQQADIIYSTSDMFLAQYGADGKLRWARRFGDSTWQRIHQLGLQSDGTIVIGGATQGTLELGGAPIVAGAKFDGVLAAFDANGQFVWQRNYSGPFDVAVERLAIGPAGRLSAYGHAGDVVDLGGGELPYDGITKWVAQFEPDGAHRWSRRFLPANYDVFHIGADSDGGLVLAGDYTPGGGIYDAFVLRHDDTGLLSWNRKFDPDPPPNGEQFQISALAVGSEVTIAGWLRGTFNLGGGELNSPVTAGYVAHFDLAGADLDATLFPAQGLIQPFAAAYGPDGERVLGGQFTNELDLGAGALNAIGKSDLFIHRFGP